MQRIFLHTAVPVGKEKEMEQAANTKMTKDAIIKELIELLNQNQQREAANNVFEMAALLDGMEQKLELMTQELVNVRNQLEKMEQEKADKSLKAVVRKAADSLELRCDKMKGQLSAIKTEVKAKASEIVAEVKAKGKAAFYRASEFLGIRGKLESMHENVKKGIGETDRTIRKIEEFGSGMREAGQKIANTFRRFADKETVDYADREKKFSKTELVKKPFILQKKLYESMERHLNAAIERTESLAKETTAPKRQGQSEIPADAEKEEAADLGIVAEQEYQYGAEAFEAYQEETVETMSKCMETRELSAADRKSR